MVAALPPPSLYIMNKFFGFISRYPFLIMLLALILVVQLQIYRGYLPDHWIKYPIFAIFGFLAGIADSSKRNL